MNLNTETAAEPTEVEEVALGVVRVPLRTPTLPPATRTNAFLLRGRSGIWVVDPGAGDAAECAALAAAMSDTERRWGVPVVGAVLTHHHPDHVGGLGWWADTVGLPVVAERRTIAIVSGAVASDALDAVRTVDWRPIDGSGAIDGIDLVFTPGHAPGHLAPWTGDGSDVLAPRVLVAGDLVSGMGTIVVNPPRGNMREYLDSLGAAIALDPALMLPSHGPGTTDAVGRLQAYREHRIAREQRVVRAMLGRGPMTTAEITAIAYDDVPSVLHGFAERSVLAHVLKLAAEDRAYQTASGWALTE